MRDPLHPTRRPRRDVTFIHNPTAGDGAAPPEAILALIEAAGYRTRDVSTDGPWEEALAAPADLVAVLGGDGTVGKVIGALVGRTTPFAVLPGGTANNIARTLGVGGDARALIGAWADAPVRPFDVWEVRTPDVVERFVEGFGGGFMGRLIERGADAERPSLILGGTLDRARHLLAEVLADEPAADWTIEVDGKDHSGRYIGVEAMSIRSIGPNATLATDADPGDGIIDVALITEHDREPLLRAIQTVLSDEVYPVRWPDLRAIAGRRVCLVPPPEAQLHIDDTPWAAHGPTTEPEGLTIALAGQVGYLSGG